MVCDVYIIYFGYKEYFNFLLFLIKNKLENFFGYLVKKTLPKFLFGYLAISYFFGSIEQCSLISASINVLSGPNCICKRNL